MVKNKKRHSVQDVVTPSRKDFEVFAKGVERLEELRTELNSMNTSKYAEEAGSIRSKLKNVSYIPQIESEMRILKAKINGSYKAGKKKDFVSDEHLKIHRKIKELEKEVEKRKVKKIGGKQAKLISEIPKIEGEIKSNKRVDNTQSLEINKIEGQISYLRKVLKENSENEKRKQELLKKIDPGVDLTVNDAFNLSLNEIKAELSKKLKARETEVQKNLQDDLEARKNNFELQYKDLENKFSHRYEEKVQNHLEKEVHNKFKGALNQRVLNLKSKLEQEARNRLRQKQIELQNKESEKLKEMHNEQAKLKEKIAFESSKILKQKEAEIGKKKKELNNVFEKKRKELAEKLQKEKIDLKKLFSSDFGKSKKELTSKEKSLKSKLTSKEQLLKLQLTSKEKELRKRL
ncbi:MAG: hypothetical protein AABW67_04440, partial [Nanoarchaeota archaeon]